MAAIPFDNLVSRTALDPFGGGPSVAARTDRGELFEEHLRRTPVESPVERTSARPRDETPTASGDQGDRVADERANGTTNTAKRNDDDDEPANSEVVDKLPATDVVVAGDNQPSHIAGESPSTHAAQISDADQELPPPSEKVATVEAGVRQPPVAKKKNQTADTDDVTAKAEIAPSPQTDKSPATVKQTAIDESPDELAQRSPAGQLNSTSVVAQVAPNDENVARGVSQEHGETTTSDRRKPKSNAPHSVAPADNASEKAVSAAPTEFQIPAVSAPGGNPVDSALTDAANDASQAVHARAEAADSTTTHSASAVESKAPDAPPTTHHLPQSLLGRSPAGEDGTTLNQADQARFIQRVARAFHSAQQHDGEIRLRLSPPELGSLRLEVKVQDGVLAARLEAETPAARTLLLDNLPVLRERLAEQGIRIEQFEVNVADRRSGGPAGDTGGNSHRDAPRHAVRPTSTAPSSDAPGESTARAMQFGTSQLNVVV